MEIRPDGSDWHSSSINLRQAGVSLCPNFERHISERYPGQNWCIHIDTVLSTLQVEHFD